jgi:hypothetical protein
MDRNDAALAAWERWIKNGAPGMSTEEFTCEKCEETFEVEVHVAYGVIETEVQCPDCGEWQGD